MGMRRGRPNKLVFGADDKHCAYCGRFYGGKYKGRRRIPQDEIRRMVEAGEAEGIPSTGWCERPACEERAAEDYLAGIRERHPELSEDEIADVKRRVMER